MDLFRRSQIGEVPDIEPRTPKRLLWALDGSSQDALGMELSSRLARRFGATVAVVDAREAITSELEAVEVARQLGGSPVPKTSGDSYEQILRAIEQTGSDLLLVPCPFGRDLERVGPDSAGTVIDVLLARSPIPLLVLRAPHTLEGDVFSRVLLTLWGEHAAAQAAARWALGLVAPGGKLELVLVLARSFFENFCQLLQVIEPDVEVSPERLSQALTQSHVRLHRALQKSASGQHVGYELQALQEDDSRADVLQSAADYPLIVLPLERDDDARARVEQQIRLTQNPVLVVPGRQED